MFFYYLQDLEITQHTWGPHGEAAGREKENEREKKYGRTWGSAFIAVKGGGLGLTHY